MLDNHLQYIDNWTLSTTNSKYINIQAGVGG